MECPECGKKTQHRSMPVSDIPRAVLADGTCDHCWRKSLNMQRRRPNGSLTSPDIRAGQHREALMAYFRDRRARGINPDGVPELDEEFEADTEWQKAERRRMKEERKERRESKDLPEVHGSGRGKVSPLRDDGDARPPASAKSWHGGLPTRHTTV